MRKGNPVINSRVLRDVILLSAIFLSLALGSCSKDSSGPEGDPDIEVSPSSLEFEVQAGGVTGKALTIKNEGDADLSVTSISADVEWLSVSLTSCGVSAGSSRSMTVSVDASGMAPGGYGGTITMVSNDPDERALTVGVTLTVIEGEEEPDIDVTPTDLSFSVPMDSSECKTLTVSNEGDDTLYVTIVVDVAWLSVSPTSFSLAPGESQDIEACIDAYGLSPENYTAALMIESNDPDEPTLTLTVALTVLPQGQPEISVTPTSLSFEVQEGSSEYQRLNVSNIGDAALNVSSISDDAAWLTKAPTSFTLRAGSSLSGTVIVRAANLSAGSYSGTITITSNDPDQATVTVTVVLTVTGGSGTTVEMVVIARGTFQMGSDNQWADSDERPVHQVTISAFSMAKYEVTNEEMRAVMQWAYDNGLVNATYAEVTNAEGSSQRLLFLPCNNSAIMFAGGTFSVESGKEDHPCSNVTWYGAQAFCNYLSDMKGLNRCISFNDWSCTWSANGYRLPTEAEWEYACRAGTTTDYYSGDETQGGCSPLDPKLDEIGWYCGNDNGGTEDVGQRLANDWGLKDMSGNVWEWCNDWYGCFSSQAQTDPTGPDTGSFRVRRGGGWSCSAEYCRSASRGAATPGLVAYYPGFRPAKR